MTGDQQRRIVAVDSRLRKIAGPNLYRGGGASLQIGLYVAELLADLSEGKLTFKLCHFCGNRFNTARRHARFCSPKCRKRVTRTKKD